MSLVYHDRKDSAQKCTKVFRETPRDHSILIFNCMYQFFHFYPRVHILVCVYVGTQVCGCTYRCMCEHVGPEADVRYPPPPLLFNHMHWGRPLNQTQSSWIWPALLGSLSGDAVSAFPGWKDRWAAMPSGYLYGFQLWSSCLVHKHFNCKHLPNPPCYFKKSKSF